MKVFNYHLFLIICSLIAAIYFFHEPKSYYPVQDITSFEQAIDQLKQCDENTLVLFDVDDVLITSPDYIARGHLSWRLRIRLLLTFPELLKESVAELIYSLVWQQAPRVLIEPQVVRIIDNLKQQGVLVIGLTSMESGGYGVISSMPFWRADMLKDMGIVFSQQYPNQVYKQLPAYRDNYPILFEGILCCNQQPKGAVLAAFLDDNNLRPGHIIFFDDSMRNLQSVGKTCVEHNIPCTLFKYRGGERFSNTLDTSSVIKQVKILINEHRWVSDQNILLFVREVYSMS